LTITIDKTTFFTSSEKCIFAQIGFIFPRFHITIGLLLIVIAANGSSIKDK